MFDSVLIANRGEIALRIIRACKELGIRTVAVYSQADEQALHVQLADDAICIGPASSTESYLKISNIISAAEIADVDAMMSKTFKTFKRLDVLVNNAGVLRDGLIGMIREDDIAETLVEPMSRARQLLTALLGRMGN